MGKKFAWFKLVDSLDDIPLKIMFKKYRQESYLKKKIIKELPLDIEPIQVFDTNGLIVKLPITESIINEKDEEYINTVVEKSTTTMIEEDCITFIYPEPIKQYAKDLNVYYNDKNLVPIFVIEQIIDRCIKKSSSPLKELHFVLIDGENSLIEYCLELIYRKINYLTIVTDRPEYFYSISTEIFESTGLIIEYCTFPLTNTITSDIVINCSFETNKIFYYLNKNAFYIDVLTNKENMRNILLKRNDLRVIDNASIKMNKELINWELCQAAIIANNRSIRRWISSGYKNIEVNNFIKISSQNSLELERLYQYGRIYS